MNDFSEIERELRNLRPAQPSPILFQRIEEELTNCRAGAAAGARHTRRFTETSYKFWFGVPLAAAAVLVLFVAVTMDRRHDRGEKVAQTSQPFETQTVPKRTHGIRSSAEFVPAGATRLVYNTRDEGLQFPRGSDQPLRRVRYQTHETWQWRNPTTGASLRVSYPSEEVVLIPVSGQ